MDIIALLAAAPASSTQTSGPVSDTDGASFAQTLNQAQAQAQVAVELLSGASQNSPAPTLLENLPLPTATLPAEPVQVPAPAPAPVSVDRWEQALQQALDAEAPTVALAAPSEAPLALDETRVTKDQEASDPLQQIRERMQLIESAGTLEPAATAVTAPFSLGVTPPPAAATQAATQALGQARDNSPPGLNAEALSEVSTLPARAERLPSDANPAALSTRRSADSLEAVTRVSDAPEQSLSSPSAWSPAPAPLNSLNTPVSAAPTLSAPLGTPQWQDGLNQQLVGLFRRGEQQMDLQLHPTDLGPLLIKLTVNDSGTHAHFLSAQANVRSVVEQAIPQLRDALAEQGITLGEASVSDQSSRQAQGDPSSGNRARSATSDGLDAPESLQEGTALSLSSLSAGIDLYT